MAYKRFIALSCLLLIAWHLVPAYSQTYNFKNYSAEQGLPFVQVFTIFQDSKGNLWTGGYGGLSKFNGKTFTNYSPKSGLANHWVTSIAEDMQGNIWVGTISGLTKFDGHVFTTYKKEDGLSGDYVNSLIADKSGNIWIATAGGITVWNGKSFSSVGGKQDPGAANVSLVYADKNGNIWMNTDKGVAKITFTGKLSGDRSFDNYSIITGIYDTVITSAAEDNRGNLWFGTRSGLVRYDGTAFEKFTTADGLLDNSIQAMEHDLKSDDIWIGTLKGLNRISASGTAVAAYRVSDVQNGNKITRLHEDAEGNLWLGTSNGLYRFRDPSFAVYAGKEGLVNPSVFPIFRDSKKNLWVGTFENGFYRYDGKEFRNFSERDGLAGTWMCAGAEDRSGNILMGTNKGLSVYNGQSFRNYYGRKDGLHGDTVSAILQDKKGRIWLGGNKGGVVWENATFHPFDLESDVQNFDVWYLFEDSRGYIWIGTYLGGLFRYDPAKDNGSVQAGIEDIGKKLRLKSKTYLSVAEDKAGNIYLGSFDGIYIYSPVTGQVWLISEHTGLSSDLVYVMEFDKEGKYLYAGTNQGINRFDAEEWNRSKNIHLKHFGQEEGFTSLETNSNGIWRDDDGTFWFGTVNGLIHFDPALYHSNTIEPATSITGIRLFYTDTLLPAGSELPYNQNNIAFEYIGICLTNPGKVRYRYKLQGFDKSWSPETEETSARYPNLAPGKYTFLVKSCNSEGVWNKEPASFPFIIAPPFWRTWWFRLSAGISAVLLIVLVSKLRADAVRKKEAEKHSRELEMAGNELKALRAQMDPHFIFNSLSSIQSFIMTKDEESAIRYLNKFARLMRMILSNSERSTITLRQEVDTLKLYLELEALRWDNRFVYSIATDPKIDPDEFRIPTMLIQPFVENAVIHGVVPKTGGRGRIDINIALTDTHIVCTVTDNGIGRKRSQELRTQASESLHESMGMKITAERLGVLNRIHHSSLNVNITDLEDPAGNPAGTKVEIFIPV